MSSNQSFSQRAKADANSLNFGRYEVKHADVSMSGKEKIAQTFLLWSVLFWTFVNFGYPIFVIFSQFVVGTQALWTVINCAYLHWAWIDYSLIFVTNLSFNNHYKLKILVCFLRDKKETYVA